MNFSIRIFGLTAATLLVQSLPCLAADAGKPKSVYAAPSTISRRPDFAMAREAEATKSATAVKKIAKHKIQTKLSSVNAGNKLLTGAPPPPPPLSKTAATKANAARLASTNSSIPKPVLNKMLATAEHLKARGQYDEAARVLHKIAQTSPQNQAVLKELASVNLARAQSYMKARHPEAAMQAARQAIVADPENNNARMILHRLTEGSGFNPKLHTDHIKLADSLAAAGRFDEAQVHYQEALRLKPTAEGHLGLGHLAARFQGDYAAKRQYEKALAADPSSSTAYRYLGQLHKKQGDLVAANSYLSRSVMLDPNDKEAGSHLVKLWEEQVAKSNTANSHLGLARAYQLNGDLSGAQHHYQEVVRLDPNHASLPAARQSFKLALAKDKSQKLLLSARQLEAHGDLPQAYKQVYDSLSLMPGDTQVRIYQGQLLEKMGHLSQAREAYSYASRLDPKNEFVLSKLRQLPALSMDNNGFVSNTAALMAAPLAASAPLAMNAVTGLTTATPAAMHAASALASGAALPSSLHPQAAAFPLLPNVVAPPDHVDVLSSFAGSMRNQMMAQQHVLQAKEDNARDMLRTLGKHLANGGTLPSVSNAVEPDLLPALRPPLPASGLDSQVIVPEKIAIPE